MSEKKKDYAEATDNDLKQARAWLAFAEGKYDDAVEMLRPMADKEDALGDEPQGIPTREMIADVLLEAKRPQQALAEYQTDLKFNPKRFNGLYGAARAAEAAGKQREANEYYALLLKDCDGSNSTRLSWGGPGSCWRVRGDRDPSTAELLRVREATPSLRMTM